MRSCLDATLYKYRKLCPLHVDKVWIKLFAGSTTGLYLLFLTALTPQQTVTAILFLLFLFPGVKFRLIVMF
jgi:hypothetical protein